MRRTARLGSTLLLATVVAPALGVGPASAAPAVEPASASGYFSSTGPQDTGTPAGTPMNIGTMVDGVGAGHLGVQGGGGQEQKVSFLLFPGVGLLPGAQVSSAQLTVPLADGEGDVQASPAPEKVQVCAIDDAGFGGEDGAALDVAPKRLCDAFSAPGKASPDGKAYVFDVTALAQKWTEANDGLALTAAADATPFQVVFAEGTKARFSYEATSPRPDAGSTGAVPTAPDTSTGGGTGTAETPALGADSGVPAFDGGSTGGTGVAEAPLTAPLDAAPLDTAAAPAVEAAPAPETAVDQVAVGRPRVLREPALTPGLPFWLGLAGAGSLLALVSLVLGDGEVPRPGRAASRLSLALQSRQQPAGRGEPRRTLSLGRA